MGGANRRHRGVDIVTTDVLYQRAGKRATLLKMDIEGFEWEALVDLVDRARALLEETGLDTFPEQIMVEVHYVTVFDALGFYGRDKQLGEIKALGDYLLFAGGYVVSHVRKNPMCTNCVEILWARVACFRV